MKKIIYLIAILGLFMNYSCSSSKTEKQNNAESELSAETIKNCDDFLAEYEKWVDDYVQVLDDYFNNPSDPEISNKYMDLMQEAIKWNTKWEALVECADDEKYEKRFEEISKDLEEKLQEVGL